MSWREITQRVLRPIEVKKATVQPHDTSGWGWRLIKGKWELHKGGDFNYDVGSDGQTGINLEHPALYSPVTGVVTNAGEGTVGRIAIRDANGFSHEILHTHSRHVAVGDPVVAGQIIGTMGNTGVDHPYVEQGKQHVHYQLKDPAGNPIDPHAYWDAQGPIDPNPAPPAYVAEYQQYLRNRSANDWYGFGGAPSQADVPDSGGAVAPADAAPPAPAKPIRRLSSPILDALPQRLAAPSVQPNELPGPDGTPSFNDRFGNWASSPSGSAPLNPYRVPQPPQLTGPLGIIMNQPLPNYPVPPPIWGFPDQSEPPGREAWSETRLTRPAWPRR